MLNCPNILKGSLYSSSFKKFLIVSFACHFALVLAIFANHAFNEPVQKNAIPVSLLFEIPQNFEPSVPKGSETQLSLIDTEKVITLRSSISDRSAERRSIGTVGTAQPGILLEQAEAGYVSANQGAELLASSKLVQFSNSAKIPEVLQNLLGKKVKSAEVKVVSSAVALEVDRKVFVKSYPQSDNVDLVRQGDFESQRSDTPAEEKSFINTNKLEDYLWRSQKKARNQHFEYQPVSILSKNLPPIYPRVSKRLGEEGVVRVRLDISSAGTTTHATIIQTSGFDRLDKAALKAVKNWRFKPAIKGGRPVETSIDIPVRFTIQ
jgi:TonB family protein